MADIWDLESSLRARTKAVRYSYLEEWREGQRWYIAQERWQNDCRVVYSGPSYADALNLSDWWEGRYGRPLTLYDMGNPLDHRRYNDGDPPL